MAITAGLPKSCTKSCPGGVRRVWVANVEDIASFTFDGDNAITAITMVATKKFYELEFKRNTKSFVETPNVSEDGCNSSITQVLQGIAQCRDQDTRNWLLSAIKQSCCGMVIAIEENNGFVAIAGFLSELNFRIGSGTEINSGTNLTDPSQFTLNLICDTTPDGLATEFTLGVAGIEALT